MQGCGRKDCDTMVMVVVNKTDGVLVVVSDGRGGGGEGEGARGGGSCTVGVWRGA